MKKYLIGIFILLCILIWAIYVDRPIEGVNVKNYEQSYYELSKNTPERSKMAYSLNKDCVVTKHDTYTYNGYEMIWNKDEKIYVSSKYQSSFEASTTPYSPEAIIWKNKLESLIPLCKKYKVYSDEQARKQEIKYACNSLSYSLDNYIICNEK